MSPLVIGLCVSTLTASETTLISFIKVCKYLAVTLVLIALTRTGFFLTGQLPQVTGLAAEVMTALLLCCLFAATYTNGHSKDLYWWSLMFFLPLYSVTRTAIAVAGITLPFTFVRMSIRKRLWIVAIAIPTGLLIFSLSRIQQKMFESGAGTLQDFLAGNIRSSGRTFT